MLAESKYKITLEEWHRMIDAGIFKDKRLEFCEGEIIELSPEGYWHAIKNETIRDRLVELFGARAYVRQAHPVLLDNWEPSPDITVCKPPYTRYLNRLPISDDIYLLIEISDSTLAYDLGKKAERYGFNNIPEYWVVDINNQNIHYFRELKNGEYQNQGITTKSQIKLAAFPNLAIDVDNIFWRN